MRLAALLALLALAGCGEASAGGEREDRPPLRDDAALTAVRDRIHADQEELAARGFHVATTDIGAGRVTVGLITARGDHAEYFRERYGPVTTEVIATKLTSLARTAIDGYRADGRALTLFYGTGGGARLERVEVEESAERVEVAIVERVPNGPRTMELQLADTTVRLDRPLGDRAVVDATKGKRVRPCAQSPCFRMPRR